MFTLYMQIVAHVAAVAIHFPSNLKDNLYISL